MEYSVRELTERDARELASWRYEPPYDFYNGSDADLQELLDGSTYGVDDESGTLVGFVAYGATCTVPGGRALGLYTPDALDIGLGMRPDLTGLGLGPAFTATAMDFARTTLGASRLRLSVATFNRRAITVYERAGFRAVRTFMSASSGGQTEFVLMVSEDEEAKCPKVGYRQRSAR